MADILVVHHHAHVRLSLVDHVRRAHHTPVAAIDLETAMAVATRNDYAVVLMGVPQGERCTSVVGRVKTEWPLAEVIVIGHSRDLGEATDAVRHGAYEYLAAPIELDRLTEALCGALERSRALGDSHVRPSGRLTEDAIFVDPLTADIFAKADRAAGVNSTVLITGESGTGKEVLARRIHRNSARQRGKFIPVNCGSLPETLIETELFGYKKGAFTGAACSTKGLIEEAEGGVLFLDEIGDMPFSMQVRLLRFLDSSEIRAVGSTVVKHVDVRVIAATNCCLQAEILEKRFREDLFFRLSVISLHLPPLRERRADIPPLVEYHASRAAHRLDVPMPRISSEAMSMLVRYDWPGNIRQLQNALEYALVQEASGVITPASLPASLHAATGLPSMSQSTPELESNRLLTTLRRHNGNHAEAAAALGISRTTLWRRLRHTSASRQLALSQGHAIAEIA